MNRANYSPTQGLTYRDVEEKRRREIVEHNSRVFAKEIVGVHGHELPKFAESAKTLEYWKLRENFYNPTPNNASSLEYQQQLKYWAKPDELRLSDVRARPGPIDPLKSGRQPGGPAIFAPKRTGAPVLVLQSGPGLQGALPRHAAPFWFTSDGALPPVHDRL